MCSLRNSYQGLGIILGGFIAFSMNSAIAQIPTPDRTLSNNSQVIRQGDLIIIEGGTRSGNNLFHSFNEFNIPDKVTVELRNAPDIQNIIARVTGKSISNIEGILKVNGVANLFLLNPNGIIFGNNATLQIGGSFIASTASSLNFVDGTKFSATNPQISPLLTISVPVGLQFGAATPASILNQSQAKLNNVGNPVGLQVQPSKTLALIGGDLRLEGGNLTAKSGRIELGSVAANSLVSLTPNTQGWFFGYEGVQNFQNIQLIKRTDITNGSQIPSQVDASNQINANNEDQGGGNIQVQGNTIEIIGFPVRLRTQATATKDGGDLTINAKKLILRDGAAISTATRGAGNGGKLTVNASDSVELIGSITNLNGTSSSQLNSSTSSTGKAGDIIINTLQLRLKDGGQVAVDSIESSQSSQLLPNQGAGGNLTVNASDSVELIGTSENSQTPPTGLFASTNTGGAPGEITITTGKLILQGMSAITVSNSAQVNASQLSSAGSINISANSILLDNKGKLTSETLSGRGGNIKLQVRDILLMRRNSLISTNAGIVGSGGDGGNITINAPNGFIVAAPTENNDITANAFSGSGGQITINVKSIFGFVLRTRADLVRLFKTEDPNELDPNKLTSNDITAFSQQSPSLNGTVKINSPDVDPSKRLLELPVNLVDVSQQIVADCNSGGKIERSSFITTGRGGLIADPTQPLIADDAVIADWISLSSETKNRSNSIDKRAPVQAQQHTLEKLHNVNYINQPTQIVEAQGWVMDANGNVVLVAQMPTATPHNSSNIGTSCVAH